MLNSITLANYKSFGREQTIELGAMTVLIGPNNSGKSAFMSIGEFVHNLAEFGEAAAVESAGGLKNLLHRPIAEDGRLVIRWESDEGLYSTALERRQGRLTPLAERLELVSGETAWGESMLFIDRPFQGLVSVPRHEESEAFQRILHPLAQSRRVKLSLNALREDAPPVASATLNSDGSGLAQVVARWRSSQPKKAALLDAFVAQCLPNITAVLADDVPFDEHTRPVVPGTKRIVVQQSDGELFDAKQISDGVLSIIALGMHAIDAGKGTVLFIEEPEQSIHPTLLHELVDLLRTVVYEQKCQVVLATHSPRLLNEFRDTPEHVLVFRRSDEGTQVKKLSELSVLMEALQDPEKELGSMFEAGLFDTAFTQLARDGAAPAT